MNVALTAVLYGLLAAVSWGFTDFLIGKSSKTVGAMKGALLVNTYGAVIFSVVYILFFRGQTVFTVEGVRYAVAGSLFLGLAQATFFKAMNLGPVGLVSSISSVYPLVTLLVSVALFTVDVSAVQILGIVLVVGGVVVASGLTDGKSAAKRLGKGPLLALLPVLGWGLGWVFIAQSMEQMNWPGIFLIETILTPVVLVILAPVIKGSERLAVKDFRAGWLLPAVGGAALAQLIGQLGVNLGMHKSPDSTAVVVAISACYPVLTIFLAVRHLKEKIPLAPLIGGIVGVSGVVILSLG